MAALQGHARAAAAEWQAAAQLNPNDPAVWDLLGELYTSTEQWQPASVALRQLARLRPDAPEVHSRLAVSLLRTGDEIGALKEAQTELKRDPHDETARVTAALLLSKIGDVDAELVHLKALAQQDPDNLYVLRLYSEALTFTNDYAHARPVLEHILQLDPENSEACSMLGMGIYQQARSDADYKQAEDEFMKALHIDPAAAFPRLYLGKIYRTRGDLKAAQFQLETAAKLMPKKMDVNFELGSLYQQMGEPKKAAPYLERFRMARDRLAEKTSLQKKCAVDPANFEYPFKLGTLYLDEGDETRARIYLAKAQALRPNDPRIANTIERLRPLDDAAQDPRAGLQNMLRATGAAPTGALGRQ